MVGPAWYVTGSQPTVAFITAAGLKPRYIGRGNVDFQYLRRAYSNMLGRLLAALSLLSLSAAQSTAYGQCGGKGTLPSTVQETEELTI